MSAAYKIGMTAAILILFCSTAIAATTYKVGGAGASEVNGNYEYCCDYDTWKSDGQYSDRPMPVYRKTGSNYYLGYRGCGNKWVIKMLPYGPDGNPNDPYDDGLAGGWGSGHMYVNDSDTFTPPQSGWEARHGTPDPPPTVSLYVPPTISLSRTSIPASSVQGTNASSQSFKVWNSGGDTLGYTISDNVSWLSCSPNSGTSSSGEQDTIWVNYNTTSLSAGTYHGTITVRDSDATNSPRTIAVTLNVTIPPADIAVSTKLLSNVSVAGTNAGRQTFRVWNAGGGVFTYTISDNAAWLTCSPDSGTSSGEQDTITVAYVSAGLSTGTHTATIGVGTAATVDETIAVSLEVVDRITIQSQPISQTKYVAQSATFNISASGPPPLSYQWKKNGAAIGGATSSSYTIANLQQTHAGLYSCVVSNATESVESDYATLEVLPNDVPTITGQAPDPMAIARGGAFTVQLDNLVVVDDNNDFPEEFTLNILPGDHYTVDGHIVTPSEDFEGDMLIVTVSVHDGDVASDAYALQVAVSDVEPVVAEIQGAHTGVTNRLSYALSVGGAGVAAYQYQIDDGAWSQVVPVDVPLAFDLNAEGYHTLEVVGGDGEGRWQSQNRATFAGWTIDTTPPETVLCDYPKGTVGTTSVAVGVGGQDVCHYRFRLDDGLWSTPFSVTQPLLITGLLEGQHTLVVLGRDTAGNWATEFDGGRSITWTIDTQVPTAVLDGLPDSVTRETSATVTVGKVSGGLEVDRFKYSLDGGVWSEGTGTTIVLDAASLHEGEHTLAVNAYNAAQDKWQGGGIGEFLESATTYTWHIDLTPPDAPVIALGHAFPTATAVSLSWAATESTLRTYRLHYSENEFDQASIDAVERLYIGLEPGPEGSIEAYTLEGLFPDTTYYIAVASEDEAGNVSALSNVVGHTTADTLPIITALGLTGGGSAADNTVSRVLIIQGNNFAPGSGNVVRFSCPPRTFEARGESEDGTSLTVTVPCGAPVGIYDVAVINANGVSCNSGCTYTVLPAVAQLPEVNHVIPPVITGGSDASLVVAGSNFTVTGAEAHSLTMVDAQGRAVNIDTFDVIHSAKISAFISAGVLVKGLYDIRVTTANGTNDVGGVRLEVIEPADLTGPELHNLTSAQGFDMSTLGGGETAEGTLPVGVQLTSKAYGSYSAVSIGDMVILAEFEPGTRIFYDDGTEPPRSYDGVIQPPRRIPITSAIAEMVSRPSHAAVFQMGAAQKLKLDNGQTIFVRINLAMPNDAEPPLVYYLAEDGSLSPTGVDGHKHGYALSQGGTVLAERHDMPEMGYTTYTIGLLLDHLSTFVVGKTTTGTAASTTSPFSVGGDEESTLGCFIETVMEK